MYYLFIIGFGNDKTATLQVGGAGEVETLYPGLCEIHSHVKEPQHRIRVTCIDGIPADRKANSLKVVPDLIFNEIGDPDSHDRALLHCMAFCEDVDRPVINRPEAILNTRRDLIYQRLHTIENLVLPKTIRLEPRTPQDVELAIVEQGLHFPVIFRQAGAYNGKSMCRIDHAADITPVMHSYALDGRAYYLTNYSEYRSPDKLYRKYRLVIIEGKPHIQHLLISDHWSVHASSRVFMEQHPDLQLEEEEFLANFEDRLTPGLSALCRAIADKVELECFGIDCSFNDQGQMVVFGINARMNLVYNKSPTPDYLQLRIDEITDNVKEMLLRRAQSRKQS